MCASLFAFEQFCADEGRDSPLLPVFADMNPSLMDPDRCPHYRAGPRNRVDHADAKNVLAEKTGRPCDRHDCSLLVIHLTIRNDDITEILAARIQPDSELLTDPKCRGRSKRHVPFLQAIGCAFLQIPFTGAICDLYAGADVA